MLRWAYGILRKLCTFDDLLRKYSFLFHGKLFLYESVCKDVIFFGLST